MRLFNLKLKLLTCIVVLLFLLSSCSNKNPIEPDNNSPIVTILTPINNADYVVGDTISFSATATDQEDGELVDSAFSWISDIDGHIGIGEAFMANSLSENTHNVILTVTDSNGEIGTDTISVTIKRNLSLVTIESPADSTI